MYIRAGFSIDIGDFAMLRCIIVERLFHLLVAAGFTVPSFKVLEH